MTEVITGGGYAVGHLNDLGDGPGFRKIRAPLGVTAFGVNAVVIPAGIESGRHFHDEQEELYFVAACLRTTTARARATSPRRQRGLRRVA